MYKNRALGIGMSVSVFLFVALGVLQAIEAKFLELPMHWIAIAVSPLILALFTGGFITRFKGFGVELETTLKAPVASLNLTASDVVADIPGDEKGSFSYLDSLPADKKLAVKWLLLRSGKKHYYSAHGIETYVRELPNIQYFEVRTESGEFICFLPITIFRDGRQPFNSGLKHDKLQQLIEAIETENVTESFRGQTITLKVKSDQSLVAVLRLMRAENVEFAAIVSPSGNYLGVLFTNEVEKKIADSVLSASTA
ncbi:MAG: hypothetical protein DWQ05_01875 [Calditrichaeota bacterium]|nr:MAG: hypothetical protein DWQ05_01875 [Calditrichota bacterium]